MSREEYKKLVKLYRGRALKRLDKVREERRALGFFDFKGRWTLYKKHRTERRIWKKRIQKVEDIHSRKAQKNAYKYFKRLARRKRVLITWAVIIGLIVLLFGSWIYGVTRPLTSEQTAAREHAREVAKEVMDEGIVLLRNENNVLPLSEKKVSVFGAESAKMVYGGGGAGGIAAQNVESLYQAFDEKGVSYDPGLYNLYNNYAYNGKASTAKYTPSTGKSLIDVLVPNISGFLATATKEMPVSELPNETVKAAADFSDTAVYVISRVGTETQDLKPENLTLSADEKATLTIIDQNFDHIVVLLNTTNAFESGFVEDFAHIDGLVWIGAPGEVGTKSVADVLTGAVNPSGRLTDTYAYDVTSNPAVINTGSFQYKDKNGTPISRYFVDYDENIYVGYRYYETFLTDDQYREQVQYPFGYGLSYSDFHWKTEYTTVNADAISAVVTVTNIGDTAGKDVVQLYYNPPFVSGGIEKSAVVLGGYAKTKLLQPGESQTVTVSFATDSMASYDDTTAKAWVLDAGTYTINVARNVHDFVRAFTYDQESKKVLGTDAVTGEPVTNRFDDARGDLTYYSRSQPDTTKPTAPTGDEFKIPQSVLDQDYQHVTSNEAAPTTGVQSGIKLADLKGLDYDDPKWDTFLDQFTDEQLVAYAGNGGYWSIAIDTLGIPKTSMYDGPASIRNFLQAWATTAFPIPVNLSATWNTALAEKQGVAMGAEAQSFNVDAVYAPSLNLHRSPLGGRNFEYYSEDPLIAGTFGAAYTRGLQSTGTVAVMKHFVANDQETHRADYGLYTWTTEQALRELYLKPFELTAKEGDAHGVMTAFNRVGAIWAGGSKALLTDVLRTEWGFKGFVVTDAGIAGQGTHFDALQAVEAGNDLELAQIIDLPGDNTYEAQLKRYLKDDRAGTLRALRNAAHNIAYYVLQTNKIK